MGTYGENLAEEAFQEKTPSQLREEERMMKKLTKNEIDRINKGESIHTLIAERTRLKRIADNKLDKMVTSGKNKAGIISTREYKDFKTEIDETESPERTKQIIEKLKKLEEEKKKNKSTNESQKRNPEDKELLDLQKKFEEICDKNEHLIGKKQVPGFKVWFAAERRKNPTVAHLKEQIRRLEGKEVTDRNGLAPRREEYKNIERLFKKFDAGDPLDCKWIEQEGLTERKLFRQNAENLEKHLEQRKGTGFYSPEMIKKSMQEILEADNPSEQLRFFNKARTIARKESESFTYLDSNMNVKGKSIRKMSEASKKKYMDYYKNTDFKEREELVNSWQDVVENEASLAEKLAEIYGDDIKGLHLALEKFQTLDWYGKQESLKMHENLVKNKEEKDERHKKLLLDAANTKIEQASKENIISEKTAERYTKLFEDENNYKNPETGEPGDLKTLEKMYEILTSPTPEPRHKNLAAYKVRREEFQEDLKLLELASPNIDEKELEEWQSKYDQEGWSKRAQIHEQLKKEVLKETTKSKKLKEKEKEAGIDDEDKKESKETPHEKLKVLDAATLYMAEDNPREALKLLLLFDEENPNDKQILLLIELAGKQLRELGSKPKKDEGLEKELEEEIKKAAQGDTNKKNIEEEQVIHLNIDGARLNEQRHDKQKRSQKRAEEDSLDQVASGSLEEDLVEDYYENTDDLYILDEDGKGEEIQEIEFDHIAWDDRSRQEHKRRTYEHQDKLMTTKEGFHTQFRDKKGGRIMSADEAEKAQEEDLNVIANNLTDEALDKISTKQEAEGPVNGIFKAQQEVMAKRKAREFIDKKIHERIKHAA